MVEEALTKKVAFNLRLEQSAETNYSDLFLKTNLGKEHFSLMEEQRP